VPPTLGALLALRELRLDDNMLSGALPTSLAALPALTTLCVPATARARTPDTCRMFGELSWGAQATAPHGTRARGPYAA
jgi:hypothetical protein